MSESQQAARGEKCGARRVADALPSGKQGGSQVEDRFERKFILKQTKSKGKCAK